MKRGACALALMVVSDAASADGLDVLGYAISGGTPSLDLRLRWEHVESDAPATPKDSNATIARTRLGYTTGKWNALDIGLEFENLSVLEKTGYNSTLNGQTTRPVIADPAVSELNQAWLRYAGFPGTTIQIGRQRLMLDNHRFVGNVGWRQNEQTYDGYSAVNKSLPKTQLTYAFLTNVNSIFGTNFPLHANIANVGIGFSDALKLTAYGYWLDFAVNAGNRQDTETLGARAAGAVAFGAAPVKLIYAAEYARQSDYEEAPVPRSAGYRLGEVGAGWGGLTAKLGHEVLGSDGGVYGFQTPLATLHAFNGWADLFLVTPPTGLVDTYVQLGWIAKSWAVMARAHQFKADQGGADYGDELDAQASYTLTEQLSVLAKYASYSADTFAADTGKTWLQAEYKF
jgi:hypothetical protein